MRSDVAAILFDEPLTVIDPHLKWNLRRKLKEIHEKLKLTFIYVTHDQVEALTFADKVVVMYEGEIVQIGSPQDLFENPEHRFVGYFIGSPGMNFLDCTLEGKVAQLNGASIVLDEEMAAKGSRAQGKLVTTGTWKTYNGTGKLTSIKGEGTFKVTVGESPNEFILDMEGEYEL